MNPASHWTYTPEGFTWEDPNPVNELYFPLCNEAGLLGSISPLLHGDLKTGQQRFLLEPLSIEDLHDRRSARNFWVRIQGQGAWSATGNSAAQLARRFQQPAPRRAVDAGFLWHRLRYEDAQQGLSSEITSFCPEGDDVVELHLVTLRNTGAAPLTLSPTAVLPIYGRGAENQRDHRHVTSLINRVTKLDAGIVVSPEIAFDERGHRESRWATLVGGVDGQGRGPKGVFGRRREFLGQGAYDWPQAVVEDIDPADIDAAFDGFECAGALRFQPVTLEPGEQAQWVMLIGALEQVEAAPALLARWNTVAKVQAGLEANQRHWEAKLGALSFQAGPEGFSPWSRWVALQPILRRLYGCSFLPHHDYGKGGRGWRDLWQDCLSLTLQEPQGAQRLLRNNFKGVRLDGTNATIIGVGAGEFIADRNSIPRVWMDHGAWPLISTRLYIDQTGDLGLLLQKEPYFRDALTRRARVQDPAWAHGQAPQAPTADGAPWMGTVLEHLLVQALCAFYHVGEHNRLRLEGGDWNDTLDMARTRGESVAFSALYAGNLSALADLVDALAKGPGAAGLEVFEELSLLLDRVQGPPLDYGSAKAKRARLEQYFDAISPRLSGRRSTLAPAALAADLRAKGAWLAKAIREEDWLPAEQGGFFRGYYNEDGASVEGLEDGQPRMYLTSQVFPILAGVASLEQCKAVHQACRAYLVDPRTGGFRLNTPLGPHRLNLGRGFAFAYGEKENGAVFSHMVVMYMNALYSRGLVHEGYEVFRSLLDLCQDGAQACLYPGLPEYFNAEGRGLYHYLTGSAAWMNLTLLTRVFGIRGEGGDLLIAPRLVGEQFQAGLAAVETVFQGVELRVEFHNPLGLDWGAYRVGKLSLNGQAQAAGAGAGAAYRLPLQTLVAAAKAGRNVLRVELAAVGN